MKIRHIALGIALSMCAATTSMAASTITSTNSNNNINSQNFRSSPFTMSTSQMTISQSFVGDEMCQYFSLSNGFMQIVQIIQGNSFFQSFGFGPPSPAPDDPCI